MVSFTPYTMSQKALVSHNRCDVACREWGSSRIGYQCIVSGGGLQHEEYAFFRLQNYSSACLPAPWNRHLNASRPNDASHDNLVGMPACRYRDTITSQLSRICQLPTSPVWRQAKDMLKEEGIETESDVQQAAAPATASADVQVRLATLNAVNTSF